MPKDVVTNRMEALRTAMIAEGIELLALGPGPHMQWLLGFQPHADERLLLLLVTQQSAEFAMPALEADSASQHTDLPMHPWADAEGPDDALDSALAAVNGNGAMTVAVDEGMRADFALALLDRLPGARHVFTPSTLGRLRMKKDEDERARLKASALLADEAMTAAFAAIRPGMTENAVKQIVEERFARDGASLEFAIIGTGGNGAFPHHHTGDTVIQAGDAIVIDIGARLGGMPSDITRMCVVGEKPEGYDEIHAIVEGAVQAAMRAAKPGVTAREIDAAARNHIAQAGYGENFLHRTGHGLGIEVHEPPYMTGSSDTVLEEGMVFSIEPGIYLTGRFGLRLEEIVYLTADGAERFSELPRDVTVVGG
ncbi:M24 family metallopeptidase [Salipiger abyssi]|uniref:M24 family metallopeptidase n=1 Tax=Salipiger abyssi TaxID=1250539 RepID=UPI001A903C6A|nr:Xaa-Pro peptidase family protein [Salipiger abyssi]MBN9887224.1 aminopeptidase P family protein [Salipiger abyssi]